MERRVVVTALVVLTLLRCAVFVVFEGSSFDSDQALIGLMAKHLVEGRAWPVFTYGQPYMLGVEAWMAAPFLWLGGTTVPMLKLPLALVNLAIAVGLVLALERWAGLRPRLAALPALFFVLAPPGTTMLFLEVSGGNVEPLLIVILLWLVRRWPVAFGAVLALGVLQREFAVFAGSAFLLLRLVDGSLRTRMAWRAVGLGTLSFAAVWQTVYLAKQFSSIDGPGTYAGWTPVGTTANLSALANHVCIAPAEFVTGLGAVLTTHLAALLGTQLRPLSEFGINSTLNQGTMWVGPVLGFGLLALVGRLTWILYDRGTRPWHPPLQFATYLTLIGIQALVAYGLLRCGEVSVGTMRYGLLGLCLPIGLLTAFLALERTQMLRRGVITLALVWACLSAIDHGRLAFQYLRDRPVYPHRVLADRLVADGIEVAYADFWDSLSTVYLADERVYIASTSVVFLEEYQWLVDERRDEAVWIKREACEQGSHVTGLLYLCTNEVPVIRRNAQREIR